MHEIEEAGHAERRMPVHSLDSAQQEQHDQNHHDETDATAWVIPPTAAVRPRRQAYDQKDDEDQQDQGTCTHDVLRSEGSKHDRGRDTLTLQYFKVALDVAES